MPSEVGISSITPSVECDATRGVLSKLGSFHSQLDHEPHHVFDADEGNRVYSVVHCSETLGWAVHDSLAHQACRKVYHEMGGSAGMIQKGIELNQI